MANGFGSLWIGTSGLMSASNGLNTTANNLSNVNTKGYVREQVVFEDRTYTKFGTASVSDQRSGLGVDIGTIVHARDVFLDKAYRSESGRYSFYKACYDATEEVETFLQESDGQKFQNAITDLYEAFAEFAKDPGDTVNQNLVLQKASLFLSRSDAVYEGLRDYQTIINTKIKDDVKRINEIGKEILQLNKDIQRIEASRIEQAMNLRDTRDLLLDELSAMTRMAYQERPDGVVKIQIEGIEFLDEVNVHEIALETDNYSGFVTPYWPQLTDKNTGELYTVFNIENVSAEQNSDMGEIKALLIQRGDHYADYTDIDPDTMSADQYKNGIGNSIMMNSEAELDQLVHNLAIALNDLYSPLTNAGSAYTPNNDGICGTYVLNGQTIELKANTRILDEENCSVGSDKELPPRELFSRKSVERYTKVNVTLNDGSTKDIYIYNEEDPGNTETLYTLKQLVINKDMQEIESLLPHINYKDQTQTDYELGKNLEKVWAQEVYYINPADKNPCSFTTFYTKWVGEVGTVGNIYDTTAKSLEGTRDSIDNSRQGVIGVSSDEELTSMIKYQQAYNASSRYINVVNEMIQHIIDRLGG
ncbi:MAG: flagellar hook-associated protein FlgK [Pseudobutyrivibrio sp.]|nr:flagellar hook-associated protein FlgK [Pseudobutyrivibrio sp.]